MRWLFLLLIALNLFYYVWNQQQAPLRATEVTPVEQYQLLERDIRLISESPNEVHGLADQVVSPPDQSACLFFGGFDSQGQAETFMQRLTGLDIQSDIQEFDAVGSIDYWVFLPPLASREASLRLLKELQARQIDSFIIADGDLENGISLGIFPRYETAVTVINRLSGAGYEPLSQELTRADTIFWVRVDPSRARLIDDHLLSVLALDFEGLQHEMKPCVGIAID